MGWEIYPQSLTTHLVRLTRDYQPPPLLITENGMANPDRLIQGRVDDAARIDEDRELMGHMPAPLLDRLRRRARAFPLNHACQAFVDLVVRSDSRAARAAAAAKEMAQGAKTWNEHVRLSPACGAHELEAGRIGAVGATPRFSS